MNVRLRTSWGAAGARGVALPWVGVVWVFITAVPMTKLFAWGEGDCTTSRGLCGLVCPSRTSERGGEGYCVKEEGGGEGEREKERALRLILNAAALDAARPTLLFSD